MTSMLPDSSFSTSIEKGNGSSFAFGVDAAFLAEGLEISITPFSINRSVSWTTQKWIVKSGRTFLLEDYSNVNFEPDRFLSVDTAARQAIAPIVRDWIRKGTKLNAGLLPTFDHRRAHNDDADPAGLVVAAGPGGQTPPPDGLPVDGPSIENVGEVKMIFASNADQDTVKGVYSFSFIPVEGPLVPARYDPLATMGRMDRPRYGVGGFHHFEPTTGTLAQDARLILHYTPADIGTTNPTYLKIYRWAQDLGDWELVGGDVDHQAGTVTVGVDRLGVYTIAPEMPSGEFSWAVISASHSGSGTSGQTTLRLRSTPMVNNTGTPVAAGTMVTVSSNLTGEYDDGNPIPFGSIVTPDVDPDEDGTQVAVGADGTVVIDVVLPGSPADVLIIAFAQSGTAFGSSFVAIPRP
jgi:hypothetical protein